ncbi:MAG: hypothetical protein EXS14_05105 [Planctomycetes bacterium]|nr:hypothetical protein [Planctomycetota bacterium]
MQRFMLVLAVSSIAAALPAQGCNGNGFATLGFGPAALSQNLEVSLSTPGGGAFFWYVDVAPGMLTIPGIGNVCLGITPGLLSFIDTPSTGLFIPGTGTLPLSLPLPGIPAMAGFTLYSQLIAVNAAAPGGIALSNPASVQLAMPDSYNYALSTMADWRGLHTATNLVDARYVFITGGGSGALLAPTPVASTSMYDHYTRTFQAGPPLAASRVLHSATRLLDGRILIAGGLDGAAILNWTDGEVYDPATNTFTPVANQMAGPRAAHTATLLNDGRVLLTGGNTEFSILSAGNFIAVFSTAINTTEIYNPVTNTFTPGPIMISKRLGHEAVKLSNGNVLVVGGINGGINLGVTALPTFTNTTQIFNPITNTFTSSGNIASSRLKPYLQLLPSGNVLMAGGAAGTFITSTATTEIRNASTGAWSAGQLMPVGSVLGGAVRRPNGSLLIGGGGQGTLANFTAGAQVIQYTEGIGWSALNNLPATRMNNSVNLMPDGTYLLAGGIDAATFTYNNALIWTP